MSTLYRNESTGLYEDAATHFAYRFDHTWKNWIGGVDGLVNFEEENDCDVRAMQRDGIIELDYDTCDYYIDPEADIEPYMHEYDDNGQIIRKVFWRDLDDARYEFDDKVYAKLGTHRGVEVDVDRGLHTHTPVEAKVNWSAMGPKSVSETKEFIEKLHTAIELAESFKYNGWYVTLHEEEATPYYYEEEAEEDFTEEEDFTKTDTDIIKGIEDQAYEDYHHKWCGEHSYLYINVEFQKVATDGTPYTHQLRTTHQDVEDVLDGCGYAIDLRELIAKDYEEDPFTYAYAMDGIESIYRTYLEIAQGISRIDKGTMADKWAQLIGWTTMGHQDLGNIWYAEGKLAGKYDIQVLYQICPDDDGEE